MLDWQGYQVERVTTIEQFRGLELEWRALENDCGDNIFLRFFWLLEWWQAYGDGFQLWILVIRSSDRLIGVLPLYRHTRLGIRILSFIGCGEVTPNHLDASARAEECEKVTHAFVSYLLLFRTEWDILDFDKLPENSLLIQEFMSRNLDNQKPALHTQISARCSYIVLPDTFEAYLQSRSHGMRKSIRKERRDFQRSFPAAQFRKVETLAELEKAMNLLIDFHQRRWIRKGYAGAFSNHTFINFHYAVSRLALQEGNLRFYYLQVDDKIIAVRYAYQAHKTVQLYLSSFDEEWAQYAPGALVLGYTIEKSINDGSRLIDFLEGDETYKDRWATDTWNNMRLYVFGSHMRGGLARIYIEGRNMLMKLATRFIPQKLRQLLWKAIQRGKASLSF